MSAPLRLAGWIVDGLIAVCFLLIVFLTINSWPIYRGGSALMEYPFEILFYLVLLRCLVAVPWGIFWKSTIPQKTFFVIVALLFALFLKNLFFVNFKSAVEAIIITRSAFQGATDEEIAIDITEHNKWYPRMSFVLQIMEEVPEDAALAYIGDQRGHIMTYLLYPRRLYSLPVMQEVLNQSIQENWTWSHLKDPFHPQKDPMNPIMEGYPQDEPSIEIQTDFMRMVEEKDIEWVIYYDSIYPEKSWFRKIDR